MDSLVWELKQIGCLSAIIPESLKKTLILLSDSKITFQHRESVLGDLLNASTTAIVEVNKMIEEVNYLAEEVKKNREEWKNFLNQKKKDILNKSKDENS